MGTHYEQLTSEERAAIMVMSQQQCSARYIARTLHRSASTITRELHRFSNWHSRFGSTADSESKLQAVRPCAYDSRAAGSRARFQRFKPRRSAKLAPDTLLFWCCVSLSRERWSPFQIAGTLKLMWPHDCQRAVSHETIYNCIYAMPRGELRKDLIACLRRAQSKLMPRSRGQDRRGQLPETLSIHVRPPEANDRAFLGHWEGDLIKGAGNRFAVGVLVERSSRLVMLAKLADATASSALEGFTAKLRSIAQPMRQTLTYDQGKEMARHAELTANTGVKVYFCDPHSPWQRGSCENINGLIRQYLPKGIDLSAFSQDELDAIADQLNSRPRAIHGFYPPISVYKAMLEQISQPHSSIQ